MAQLDAQHVFSPAFLYHQINNHQNIPVFFTDAFDKLEDKSRRYLGAVSPYDERDFESDPPTSAFKVAGRYKILEVRNLKDERIDGNDLKGYLSSGIPIVIAASVDDSVQRLRFDQRWGSQ